MKQKILFLDLDGTLLNDAKEITDGNRRALEAALSLGHRVVITTGRPLVSALEQNRRLGLTGPGCYVIAYNGGLIADAHTEQVIYRDPLPRETALKAIALADRTGIHVQTYSDTHVLVAPHNDNATVRRYCGLIHMEFQVVEDLAKALTWDPPKVLAIRFDDRPALEALQGALNRELGQELDCFFSSNHLLEVSPKGMNKGAAVRGMCRLLGVDIADAIAVGDEANDLTMIEAAGIGVAMANGIPAVKAAANYVTTRDNNHDAIAEVVEHFLLP